VGEVGKRKEKERWRKKEVRLVERRGVGGGRQGGRWSARGCERKRPSERKVEQREKENKEHKQQFKPKCTAVHQAHG